MISGRSNRSGIMFSESAADGMNAVFCWREDGEILTVEGNSSEIAELFDEETKAGKSKSVRRKQNRALAALVLSLVALMAANALFGTPLSTAASIAFALTGSFPAAALLLTLVPRYESEEDSRRMRRYHGAEHAAIAFWRKNKSEPGAHESLNAESLVRYSHIDPECGTVYLSSALILSIVLASAIALSPKLGIVGSALLVVGAAIVLIANAWFNPLNPLKAAQLRMVEKPTEHELEVAAAGLRRLVEMTRASELAPKHSDEPGEKKKAVRSERR